MPEIDKTEETRKAPPNKQSAEEKNKKPKSKEVIERARRIVAARRKAELQKAAEERKERMAKRAEAKKIRLEDAKKKASEAKKGNVHHEEKTNVTAENPAQHKEEEYIDFAVTARKYKTLPTKKFKERKFWENPSPYEIQSYIPGTIVSIDVKEGKIVQEGTQLLILEAMKMQNRIDMPFTARIKKINVTIGERIPKDFIMIELEQA